jgi:DNA (cytosine-5)-methyltransferase 1
MKLLDLFCGGGGAAMGYHRAGFEVIGVDNQPQPHYPFKFIQADALCYAVAFGRQFDVIHASPPCQAYSRTKSIHGRQYKGSIEIVRKTLEWIGKPFIIENVVGAPLQNPIRLRGDIFGLQVLRDRLFETHPWMLGPPLPKRPTAGTNSHRGLSSFKLGASYITVAGHNFIVAEAQDAMGIDWLDQSGLSQAIPPAYTEWIGKQMMRVM